MKRSMALIVLCLLVTAGSLQEACCLTRKLVLSGRTMGTFFQVTAMAPDTINTVLVEGALKQRLHDINASMSTYMKTSEISRFNQIDAGIRFDTSDDFNAVLAVSKTLYGLTSGAWDGTVKPLVDLWGFGKKPIGDQLPGAETVLAVKDMTGFDKLAVYDHALEKLSSGVSLDLASIAKGYGVDVLGNELRKFGIQNFIVEIGGEVLCSGRKKTSKPWSIGISRPEKDATAQGLYAVVLLEDQAMATSGDYRNYTVVDGRTYSHIIDPATGYPVDNGVVSASVIADTCVFADGLATALMVMGPDKGLAVVNSLDRVETLIVVRSPDGSFVDYKSRGFDRHLSSVE